MGRSLSCVWDLQRASRPSCRSTQEANLSACLLAWETLCLPRVGLQAGSSWPHPCPSAGGQEALKQDPLWVQLKSGRMEARGWEGAPGSRVRPPPSQGTCLVLPVLTGVGVEVSSGAVLPSESAPHRAQPALSSPLPTVVAVRDQGGPGACEHPSEVRGDQRNVSILESELKSEVLHSGASLRDGTVCLRPLGVRQQGHATRTPISRRPIYTCLSARPTGACPAASGGAAC